MLGTGSCMGLGLGEVGWGWVWGLIGAGEVVVWGGRMMVSRRQFVVFERKNSFTLAEWPKLVTNSTNLVHNSFSGFEMVFDLRWDWREVMRDGWGACERMVGV